jgi:glycosyltransferase involved in cell wall biosynthesis
MRFIRRKRVILSIHEVEPAKFPSYHHIQGRLNQHVRFSGPLELARLVWVTVEVSLHYLALRVLLVLLGWLPHVIVVHSTKTSENVGLMLANRHKATYIPHVIKPQDGDREALRAEFGLPQDRFLFISPGFLFRRKRILETIEQLPVGTELLIVGLPSEYDPGYLEEIQAYLAQHPEKAVRIIQDYDNMERYLMAADAGILYYQSAYQSGIACLALGAGKPCVFSDLPAFAEYREAGLFVQTPDELHQAMKDIQRTKVYTPLRAAALRLREELGPERIASRYLNTLTPLTRIEPPENAKEDE